MTEFRFECPRCGGREYGTITHANGSQAYACHGLINVDRIKGITRSCDYETPVPIKRTRSDRAATITQLGNAALQMAHGFTTLDPDDEMGLDVLEASLGQMQSTVILLKDDAVSARLEREREGGAHG